MEICVRVQTTSIHLSKSQNYWMNQSGIISHSEEFVNGKKVCTLDLPVAPEQKQTVTDIYVEFDFPPLYHPLEDVSKPLKDQKQYAYWCNSLGYVLIDQVKVTNTDRLVETTGQVYIIDDELKDRHTVFFDRENELWLYSKRNNCQRVKIKNWSSRSRQLKLTLTSFEEAYYTTDDDKNFVPYSDVPIPVDDFMSIDGLQKMPKELCKLILNFYCHRLTIDDIKVSFLIITTGSPVIHTQAIDLS